MKRSLKFWLLGVAVVLAVSGAVPAQAACCAGRPARVLRFVGRVVTAPVRIVRTSRPCNRVEAADVAPVLHWAPSRTRTGGCSGGVCQ